MMVRKDRRIRLSYSPTARRRRRIRCQQKLVALLFFGHFFFILLCWLGKAMRTTALIAYSLLQGRRIVVGARQSIVLDRGRERKRERKNTYRCRWESVENSLSERTFQLACSRRVQKMIISSTFSQCVCMSLTVCNSQCSVAGKVLMTRSRSSSLCFALSFVSRWALPLNVG